MCKCDTKLSFMPSQRKRIGFLPSKEVHDIIDKLCNANKFSQSKVTGILVEEALRYRGVLSNSFTEKSIDITKLINNSFAEDSSYNNNKSASNIDDYTINKKIFNEDIRMIHEFIEFKYFKKVMKQNKDILE